MNWEKSYNTDEENEKPEQGFLTAHDIEQDEKYIKEIIRAAKHLKTLLNAQYERDVKTYEGKPIFWRSEDEGREISSRSDLLSEIEYELNERINDLEKLIK